MTNEPVNFYTEKERLMRFKCIFRNKLLAVIF